MQKMLFASPKKISDFKFRSLNILFFLFPISFLVGNAMINSIVLLVCVFGIFTFSKKFYLIKKDKIVILFFSFFLVLFFSTLLEIWRDPKIPESLTGGLEKDKNDSLIKSITYFRYFFLFLITALFLKSGKFNFKLFLISSLICTVFLSLDIIYQFMNGSDIFGFVGYEKSNYHLAGFLRNEYIAGSYIQKFFLFSLIFSPFIFKKWEKYKFFALIFLSIIFFLGILYSGNRMPLILFISMIFIMMILIKDFRIPLSVGFVFCLIIFYLSFNNFEKLRTPYQSFYDNTSSMWKNMQKYSFKNYPELENQKETKFKHYFADQDYQITSGGAKTSKYEIMNFGSGHAVLYMTAIDLWKDSPIIGSGIKSFRINCFTKLYKPNRSCEGHPHNYYLELLNDTGLMGTIVFLISIFLIFKNNLMNFKKYKKEEKLLFICFFIIIFAEFFPIKSSGSFFSTSSSAYIFFLLGMFKGLEKIKN